MGFFTSAMLSFIGRKCCTRLEVQRESYIANMKNPCDIACLASIAKLIGFS